MPAPTCELVSTALRNSLSSDHKNDTLDDRLHLVSAKVLNTKMEFEKVESYNSSIFDNIKTKCIILNPQTANKINNYEDKKKENSLLPKPKQVLYSLDQVQLGWQEKKNWHTGSGMVNMGYTCYLNSALQALFHTPAFINWLISDLEHRKKCDDCIVCSMAKTFLSSQENNTSIRPWIIMSKLRGINSNFRISEDQQEDAHEFLRVLIEAMERAYIQRFNDYDKLDPISKETTPLNQILGGYLKSSVKCLQCNHISNTIQHFQDLLLDIRKVSTMEEALQSYFACERLEDSTYKCESCRKKVAANKRFRIERAPFVLCIQFKRFAGSSDGKISKHVSFSQRLDLTEYCNDNQRLIYKLVAVITHKGTSANYGHYTAMCATPSGNYYEFDDSLVRPVSQQVVFNTNAYVMIYELEKPKSNISQTVTSTTVSDSNYNSLMNETNNKSIKNDTARATSIMYNNSNKINDSKSNNNNNYSNGVSAMPKTVSPSSSESKTSTVTCSTTLFSSQYNAKSNLQNNLNEPTNKSSTTNNISKENNFVNNSKLLNNDKNSFTNNDNEKSVVNPKNGCDKLTISCKENGNGVVKLTKNQIENNLNKRLVPYDSDTNSASDYEDTTPTNIPSTARTKDVWSVTPINDTNESNNNIWSKTNKNNNYSNNNSFGSISNNSVTNQLKNSSINGYGQSIKTWSGEKSAICRETERERANLLKRSFNNDDENDDLMDSGRVKKKKNNNHHNNQQKNNPLFKTNNNKYFNQNGFQEYQNRQNNFSYQHNNNRDGNNHVSRWNVGNKNNMKNSTNGGGVQQQQQQSSYSMKNRRGAFFNNLKSRLSFHNRRFFKNRPNRY